MTNEEKTAALRASLGDSLKVTDDGAVFGVSWVNGPDRYEIAEPIGHLDAGRADNFRGRVLDVCLNVWTKIKRVG